MGYNASNDQIAADIAKYVNGRNAERNRKILCRRLVDGLTYEKLAEEFELSVRQTKNIIYRAEDQLFRHVRY